MMWLILLLALSPAFVVLTASAPGSSCLAEDIVVCRDTQIADAVVAFRNSHKKGHNPFSVSLGRSSPVGSHKYYVEVSGNDPEAQVVAFVLQVCRHEDHETSKFTSSGNESWKIVSCIKPDDTVFQLISAPTSYIAVDLISKATTVSLRYLLVDDKMAVYEGTQIVSPASTVISQHVANNYLRRKRVVTDDPSAYLLMANGDYLHKISLDGNQVQTPVLVDQFSDNIQDIDYHYRQSILYWTDNMAGKIMRSNLDGSGVSTVIEEGLMEPDGIAVDWVTNKLYFTDRVLDIVGVFDLEANLFKVLISTLGDSTVSEPRAIVVDPSTRWVYWTDWGEPAKIERASMDGRNRTVLHNTGLRWPNGITLDYSRQVLYWVDASMNVLQSSNVDGSNRITLANQATGLFHTFGITFINDILFFTDWNGNRLQSIPMGGSALTTVFDDTCTVPYGLVAVSESRQSELTNTCSGSSCSHLCLLSSIDPRGYSCSCADGYSLATDQQNCFQSGNVTDYSSSPLGTCMAAGHSTCCVGGDCGGSPLSCYCDANCHMFGDCCQDVPTDCISAGFTPYLVYASQLFIHLMTLPVNATDTQVRARIIVSGFSTIADIDFHYRDGHLYWSDVDKMEVWRSNFDGSGAVKILDTGSSPATDIAVDWVTNKLYWVNGTDSTINIFDLSSGSHVTILTVDGTVTDIALHPVNREMYISVSDSGGIPRIEKASMDGSNRVTFQSTDIGLPSSLIIDDSLEVVWADTQQNRIESATFDGLSRGVAYSSLPSRDPLSFAIHLDTLYFVGFFEGVYAVRTDSNLRLLNPVGCTVSDSIQVISSARQPLVSNPCADNNGGCSTTEMCVLSSEGNTCLTVETTLSPPPPLGTCAAAGITECCVTGSCMGNPPTCSCSTNCQLFRNCCPDIIICTTEPTTDTTITTQDGCSSEEYMGYSWPETHLGTMATAACPCAEILGDSAGEVKRFCGGTFSRGGEWGEGLDVSCETTLSEVSRQLCDIALGVSANQSVQASRNVLNVTSSPQNLTTSHVTLATSVVEQLTEEAATNPEVRNNYLLTIDNIQQADADVIVESEMTMNTTLRILNSLGTFLDNLDITTVNSSGNVTTFTFSTYAIQVQEVDPNSFNGQTFIVNLGSVEQAMNSSGVIEQESLVTIDAAPNDISGRRRRTTELSQNDTVESTASLQLTPLVFENCVSNESSNSSSVVSQRLSYSVFVSDVLFFPENRTLNQVGSIVVSVRLRCQLANKTTLVVPVKSTFRVSQMDGVANSSCAVYKTEDRFGKWNTDGCREVTRSDGILECECTQLGHFGILLDLNPTSLPEPLSIILSVVTFVGLGLSIICLVVFILTYLLSKKLRVNTHGHVLINMSISLLGLYVSFLIAGFTTGVPGLCGVVSALVQYFFLVFFAWTTAESIWLYLKLVTVLGSDSFTFRYTLKSAVPAWLIPVLIVAVSGGAGHQFYTNRYYCRPTEWPFYFGFILPFLGVYIINWIFFVLIMISICRHTRKTNILKENTLKEKTLTENVRGLKVNFIIALSLAVVLGLGWAFGLVATSSNVVELTFTLQIIFGVFVGSQGVLIFILHGVRNEDFRKFWARFVPALRKRLPRDTISSERGQIKLLRFNRGSGTDSVTFSNGSGNESIALSDHSSIPQKTDLSKRHSSSVTFVSEGSSVVQSPTDSVFETDSEMFSNLIPSVEPSRMKRNESKQTVQANSSAGTTSLPMKRNESYQLQSVQANSSAGGPGPQYEEILPGNGETTSLPMKRNESYELHTVQANSSGGPGPQYEEILPGNGETTSLPMKRNESYQLHTVQANSSGGPGPQYEEILPGNGETTSLPMKRNESYQLHTVQANSSAGGPGPQYEEISPGNGETNSLPMKRNESYELHTVQANSSAGGPGPQYEQILPGTTNLHYSSYQLIQRSSTAAVGNPPQYEEVTLAGENAMVIANVAMTANESNGPG